MSIVRFISEILSYLLLDPIWCQTDETVPPLDEPRRIARGSSSEQGLKLEEIKSHNIFGVLHLVDLTQQKRHIFQGLASGRFNSP